jgi:hypothetical protein
VQIGELNLTAMEEAAAQSPKFGLRIELKLNLYPLTFNLQPLTFT